MRSILEDLSKKCIQACFYVDEGEDSDPFKPSLAQESRNLPGTPGVHQRAIPVRPLDAESQRLIIVVEKGALVVLLDDDDPPPRANHPGHLRDDALFSWRMEKDRHGQGGVKAAIRNGELSAIGRLKPEVPPEAILARQSAGFADEDGAGVDADRLAGSTDQTRQVPGDDTCSAPHIQDPVTPADTAEAQVGAPERDLRR